MCSETQVQASSTTCLFQGPFCSPAAHTSLFCSTSLAVCICSERVTVLLIFMKNVVTFQIIEVAFFLSPVIDG